MTEPAKTVLETEEVFVSWTGKLVRVGWTLSKQPYVREEIELLPRDDDSNQSVR